MDELTQKRWQFLCEKLSNQFADGDQLNIDGILFLIGVQELGAGYQKFKKREKQDILHIAVCTVLEIKGFYHFIGLDEQGWPHFEIKQKLPILKPLEQEGLMKLAIMEYFELKGYLV